jgi:hypothetical protein
MSEVAPADSSAEFWNQNAPAVPSGEPRFRAARKVGMWKKGGSSTVVHGDTAGSDPTEPDHTYSNPAKCHANCVCTNRLASVSDKRRSLTSQLDETTETCSFRVTPEDAAVRSVLERLAQLEDSYRQSPFLTTITNSFFWYTCRLGRGEDSSRTWRIWTTTAAQMRPCQPQFDDLPSPVQADGTALRKRVQ